MSLLFNPNDRDLKQKIQRLAPSPGYCVIADIVGSTKMKDDALPSWAARIYNTFSLLTSYLHVSSLKSIGDALMF
jgi:class 3 adenylate cyclase